jgi:hypothetical protein
MPAAERDRATPAGVAAVVLLLTAGPTASPTQVKPPELPPAFASYGTPEPLELYRIANNGDQYHRTNVVTSGDLRVLPSSRDYLVLADGTARVLVIPAVGDARQASRLLGRHVQATGIVRVLPARQETVGCRGQRMLASQCEDPELPPLPDARSDWPLVSISVISLSDIGTSDARPPGPGGIDLAALATDGGRHEGETVTVVGLFAGRDLFGDLPAGSARTPADWVLKLGPSAIWVTGKKPEGKGWRLDPAYKGDTVRWLQVTGRVETQGEVTFLRASKVALASAPKETEE